MYKSLLEIFGNLLLLIILWRAVAVGMLRQYPAFYLYISFVLACSISQVVLKAIYGVSSDQYYYAYYIPSILTSGLLIWVLREICVTVVGNTKSSWSKLYPAAILVCMVAFGAWLKVLTIPDAGFFMRFQAVALPTQVMIALVVLYRLSSECLPAELGRNVTGMLFGISLIVGVQAINFTSYLFFGQPYQLFGFVLQFGYFLALGVFCVSLWEYRPVRRLEPATQGQIADVDEKFQRVVKALLLNK